MDESFFDLYIVKNFLDEEICRNLIAEMRQSPASLAQTYGKGEAVVDERVRRARSATVSRRAATQVAQCIGQTRKAIASHFGIDLSGFEEPQFLCYGVGDFFVAHQDGNTGLVQLETDRTRRISLSIFLNNQSSVAAPDRYCGGGLVFSDWRPGSRQEVRGEAGMLIAFRSELTHEVTPVTHGERCAIVSWYRK